MIGRRLTSGLYAVPVFRVELLRATGRWTRVWRIELECGHVLESHQTYTGDHPPRWAGCPQGCAAEIGDLRRALQEKREEIIKIERARWARRRAARARPR